MITSDFIQLLKENPDAAIHVMLPNGDFVAENFHITEVGRIHKQFIDCGGTSREVTVCALQIWVANDVEHRINTTKLHKIIVLTGSYSLGIGGLPLVVEYGSDTITQYPVANIEVTPNGLLLVLGNKPTACLAPDKCGVKGCC